MPGAHIAYMYSNRCKYKNMYLSVMILVVSKGIDVETSLCSDLPSI